MCGATRPMNPIVPTNATAVAVRTETRISPFILILSTFTPRLLALSSPSLRAVSFQTSMASSGITTRTIPTVMPRVVQLALVRLPKSQKTMAWTCSGFAVYCRSARRESNRNSTAMPVRTIVSEVACLNLAIPYIAMQLISENTNALIGTNKVSANGSTPTPSTMASAAPNPAAADMPSVYG